MLQRETLTRGKVCSLLLDAIDIGSLVGYVAIIMRCKVFCQATASDP